MIQAGLYNLDCMDAMKEFPDKFFDWHNKNYFRRYKHGSF